jgi:hypothetical protein
VTGYRFCSWLEPGFTVTLSTVVDVSLQVAYMTALHETSWYVYFRPSISKSLELHSMVSLDLAFGFGYKIYNSSADSVDNIWDVQLDVAVTVSPLDWLYVMPAVHFGWSDFTERDFADEYLIWGSLNVGVDI